MSRTEQGTGRWRRWRYVAVALAAFAAAATTLGIAGGGDDRAASATIAAGSQPNVIVVSTDDQALSWFSKETMPHTWRQIVRKGTRFANAIVPTPLCCPSRAAYLTGQYGHNNGVLRNRYGDLEEKANVLPAWLRNAGYTTAHVGKWLNDYENTVDDRAEPAPGWDIWRAAVGNPTFYDARISFDGVIRRFGRKPGDLLTKKVGLISRRLVRQLGEQPKPFYLQIDEFAPHGDNHHHEVKRCPSRSPEPSLSKFKLYKRQGFPRGRGFNEHDVSDKPDWVQRLKPITFATRQWLRKRYRCALASVRTVDSQIGKLLRTIETAGLAENTIVVFWSDNGYLSGEHRMSGKARPYEQALRVPLAIRVPRQIAGRKAARVVSEPVANIDLAPTILRYAGAVPCRGESSPCRLLDGRPLNSLIRGRLPGDWPRPRLLLVEKDRGDDGALPPTPGPYDPYDPNEPKRDPYEEEPGDEPLPNGSACTFTGLWTPVLTYSVYTSVWDREKRCIETRQVEIYNTRRDPYQLRALPPRGETWLRGVLGGSSLLAELERLTDCAGTSPLLPKPCD